jgi:hypothetical protein
VVAEAAWAGSVGDRCILPRPAANTIQGADSGRRCPASRRTSSASRVGCRTPRARRGRSPRRMGGPALALGVLHPGPVGARYGNEARRGSAQQRPGSEAVAGLPGRPAVRSGRHGGSDCPRPEGWSLEPRGAASLSPPGRLRPPRCVARRRRQRRAVELSDRQAAAEPCGPPSPHRLGAAAPHARDPTPGASPQPTQGCRSTACTSCHYRSGTARCGPGAALAGAHGSPRASRRRRPGTACA